MPMILKKEREGLPESVFGDPTNRLFPVRSKEDLTEYESVLEKSSGSSWDAIKARIASIAKGKGWNVPAGFSDDGSLILADSISFEIGSDSYAEGDFVIYPGRKLFPAGWYASHNYGMTPEELALIPFTCVQAPLDLEHKDTVIKDEYIGHGRNFTAAWEGEDWVMRGDIAVHSLLDPLLKAETKMSTTWDRDTKSLTKIALLLNPRIPDADLRKFSEFATKHTTNTGKTALQNLHDHAVRYGAVCDSKNVAGMASKDEHKAIQAVHDQMVVAGASCEGGDKTIWPSYYSASGTSGEGAAKMDGATVETPGAKQETPPSPKPTAEMSDIEARLKATEVKLAQKAAQSRHKEAEMLADSLIGKNVLLPGKREIIVGLAERLLEDDETDSAEIAFGKDSKGSRADGLKLLFEGVKPHRHTEELFSLKNPGNRQALMEDDGDSQDATSTAQRVRKAAEKYRKAPAVAAQGGK